MLGAWGPGGPGLGGARPQPPAQFRPRREQTRAARSLRTTRWPACWTWSWPARRPPRPRCSGPPSSWAGTRACRVRRGPHRGRGAGARGHGPRGHSCPPPAGRVQEELDRVLGRRPPRPEDQRALPYTSAVLHEVQRFITLLPHVPRCAAAATPLRGFLLPEVGARPRPARSLARVPGSRGRPERGSEPQSGALACGRGSPVLQPPISLPCALCPSGLGPAGVRRVPAPPHAAPPAGHARGPPAELRAPGRDAVGDAPPVQPRPLPGRPRALRAARGLPALLRRYPPGGRSPGRVAGHCPSRPLRRPVSRAAGLLSGSPK